MDTNLYTHERATPQGPRRKKQSQFPFEKLSFETFVKHCWIPKDSELGRLTGTFQPLMHFDFLPITCADWLADVKRDAAARKAESLEELLISMRHACNEAQVAACLV